MVSSLNKLIVLGRKKRSLTRPVPSTSFNITVSGNVNIPGKYYDDIIRLYCVFTTYLLRDHHDCLPVIKL